MSEIEHEYTDEAVCPWCGHKRTETRELFTRGYMYRNEVECAACGRAYACRMHVEVSYSTEAVRRALEEER